VILLDFAMPEVDGWTFRTRQRAHREYAANPVIVISAGMNLKAGVDRLDATAILPKPFDLDVLLAAEQLVAKRATAGTGQILAAGMP
jgi:DNA-binding response OmpR family regulator